MSGTDPASVVAGATVTTPELVPASDTTATPPPGVRRRAETRRGLVHTVLRNRKALVGAVTLALFALLALLTPLLAPGDPTLITSLGAQAPSGEHLFGTTAKGQDVLALTLWGARSSLMVGFVVGLGATALGIIVGLCSAYYGRLIDEALSLVTNVFLLLPGLPLLVILAAFLPPGRATVIVVLIVTGWAGSARVLRAQALSIRGKDFVEAAVVTGERAPRIMLREILPNMASILMTTFLGCVIFGIGAQAGLEFLGLGDSSVVSWGTNLYWAANDGALMSGQWWAFVPSGAAIAIVAFALALINYGVDEVTNPRLRTARRRRAHRSETEGVR
jgi:peptide/nickel transport system permease protein